MGVSCFLQNQKATLIKIVTYFICNKNETTESEKIIFVTAFLHTHALISILA